MYEFMCIDRLIDRYGETDRDRDKDRQIYTYMQTYIEIECEGRGAERRGRWVFCRGSG